MSKVSRYACIPWKQLLADNLDTITDLTAPIAGKTLLLCGGEGAPSPAPNPWVN